MAGVEENCERDRRSVLKKALLFILVFLIAGATGFTGWYLSYVNSPGPGSSEEEIVVMIPPGTSFKGISSILAEAGLIREDFRFLLLARLSGLGKRLQAGEFRLQGGSLPRDVLLSLATSRPVQHAITLPEGWNAREIARYLDDEGWGDSRSFLSLVRDKGFIEELGLAGVDSLEGYLFPDTYHFTRTAAGSREIIVRMVERFHSVWADISSLVDPKPDRERTVILASMVEKETGSPAERPMIAGVFINRLRLGMRLQSDPTVLYGLAEPVDVILRSHLDNATPYNTYVIKGLPAGPICNPGEDALRAVLFPEQTKNLYFVSRNDGTHQFSSTLRDHNSAVRKYQRKKNVKEGKQE